MKNPTEKELEDAIEPLVKWKYSKGSLCIEQSHIGNDIILEVHAMYDRFDLTYAVLDKISELYESKKIDFLKEINEGGCESCDYGSRYGFQLRIKE